jgi:hypothetical protein
MQQKLTWIDAIAEASFEESLADLENNQAFLEQFHAVSMLLAVLNESQEVSKAS